jgi:hypothetical protein
MQRSSVRRPAGHSGHVIAWNSAGPSQQFVSFQAREQATASDNLVEGSSVMAIMIYAVFWLLSSFGLLLFGFLMGRSSRKLPIADSTLPWILHRNKTPTDRE